MTLACTSYLAEEMQLTNEPLDRSIHIHIRRWVVWWFYLGIVCGGIALANIITRSPSRTDETILLMGALHWVLGRIGLLCLRRHPDGSSPPAALDCQSHTGTELKEWFCASEFVLPGAKKVCFPPGR